MTSLIEYDTALIEDTCNAVYSDKYFWMVIWSPPRWGKTIVAGWIMYHLYDQDWTKVLQSIGFNLDGVMYRIEEGLPVRKWTGNGLHNRVPGVVWDDFGGHTNKAETRHDESFDLFKGGFDVLGTQIAVLVATMLDPSEATFQLSAKYTHEIRITSPIESENHPGTYKYDAIEWQQDFRGHRIRPKKTWIETQEFTYWPRTVYQEYDKMRTSLSSELFQRIKDKRRETELDRIVRMLKPSDLTILKMIEHRGPCNKRDITNHLPSDLPDNFDDSVITRLRSRDLLIPYKTPSGHYKNDLSYLGLAVLQFVEKAGSLAKAQGEDSKKLKERIETDADKPFKPRFTPL